MPKLERTHPGERERNYDEHMDSLTNRTSEVKRRKS